MDDKIIKLLKGQAKKLHAKEFDLEAWKSSTIPILSKAFGTDDPLVEEIQKLKIDYGSWALRDAKASYDPIETCKKVGKEVIEIALAQMESKDYSHPDSKSILEQELKQSTLEQIYVLIDSNKSESKKKEELIEILKSFEQERLFSLLAQFILKK